MRLETKRLILRELTMKDLKDLVRNVNNLHISKYLSLVSYPYSIKDGKWFINHCNKEAKKKPRKNYEFVIELKSEKRLVGIISLTDVNRFDERAGFGYWLGERYWRQRIMTEAFERLINFAFNTLKLRRLDVEAYPENKASNDLIKKMGFRYEGRRRKFVKAKATKKIHDLNIYGLLKEKWGKRKK